MLSHFNNKAADRRWMAKALALARRGMGHSSPNPAVGAVVVKKGQLISSGWHMGPGTPHAEVVALEEAGDQAQGATLYVTLEPCSHHGRTPPCADRVIDAGIKRVVAAMGDPNPLVNGQGFARLQAAGIQVETGLFEREARLLNRSFLTFITQQRPYVYLKVAQSLDGKVATRSGASQWITQEKARESGHRLRAEVDAILVGVGTVLADDPRLSARLDSSKDPRRQIRQPLRVILDSQCRTPTDARCLQIEDDSSSHGPPPTLIATTNQAPTEKIRQLQEAGADVWVCPSVDTSGSNLPGVREGKTERVDIQTLMEELGRRGITSVMVEGGPTVAGSFIDSGLVDEVRAYIAPLVIGGEKARTSVSGIGASILSDALRLIDVEWHRIGDDLAYYGRVPRSFLGD